MLEKIEIGKTYINACGNMSTVLFIGKVRVFSVYKDGSEGSDNIAFVKREWSELPKPKKRYWLWDVGNPPDGGIFKSSAYLNEDGQTTNGVSLYEKEQLLKKHESEFIDIEES